MTKLDTSGDNSKTPSPLAKGIVWYFHQRFGLSGFCMDCCAGDGVFWRYLTDIVGAQALWCEVQLDRDFLQFSGPHLRWIITNPPWGTPFLDILRQAFAWADNVVFVIPKRRADGLHTTLSLAHQMGFGIRTVIRLPKFGPKGGTWRGGIVIATVHWQRAYRGQSHEVDWSLSRPSATTDQSPRRVRRAETPP